jgi:hypothetical protein
MTRSPFDPSTRSGLRVSGCAARAARHPLMVSLSSGCAARAARHPLMVSLSNHGRVEVGH